MANEDVVWDSPLTERYCVDSGRPTPSSTDRCVIHADAKDFCYTSHRHPRCTHQYWKSHPYPRCLECGLTGQRRKNT